MSYSKVIVERGERKRIDLWLNWEKGTVKRGQFEGMLKAPQARGAGGGGRHGPPPNTLKVSEM